MDQPKHLTNSFHSILSLFYCFDWMHMGSYHGIKALKTLKTSLLHCSKAYWSSTATSLCMWSSDHGGPISDQHHSSLLPAEDLTAPSKISDYFWRSFGAHRGWSFPMDFLRSIWSKPSKFCDSWLFVLKLWPLVHIFVFFEPNVSDQRDHLVWDFSHFQTECQGCLTFSVSEPVQDVSFGHLVWDFYLN